MFFNMQEDTTSRNAHSILISEKCYKNFRFDVCNVLFSVYPLGDEYNSNFVILYTKQYIFSCLKQN